MLDDRKALLLGHLCELLKLYVQHMGTLLVGRHLAEQSATSTSTLLTAELAYVSLTHGTYV